MTEKKKPMDTENSKPEEVDLKVEITLVDSYEFAGDEIKKLIIRRPKGDDFKGLSISDVMQINGRALEVLLPKIVINTIMDAKIVREMSQANLLTIVEGIGLFVDDAISDYEDFVQRNGKIVNVILPIPYSKNNHEIKSFKMNLPQSGELRGIGVFSLLQQDFNAISRVAPRCIMGVDLDHRDIRLMPIENVAVISHALSLGLEDESKARPKFI